jgi:Zn-dependent alcohol dehydrogenase
VAQVARVAQQYRVIVVGCGAVGAAAVPGRVNSM